MALLSALSAASPALLPQTAFAAEKASQAATEQQELISQAKFTAQRFENDPGIAWVRRNVGMVKGIFIIPEQVKGAFVVGGAGGSGVLLARRPDGTWSYPSFYGTGSVSFGFQAGGDVSEIVLLVMTEKGLNAFKNASVKLGADVSVTAGPVGAGAKAETADILAFSRQKGLYGGISVQGTVISARNEWNSTYYAKPVTPAQIMFGHDVTNPAAEPLREAVAALAMPQQTEGMR
jgi:lipid-binding SYLF domain-containing protein